MTDMADDSLQERERLDDPLLPFREVWQAVPTLFIEPRVLVPHGAEPPLEMLGWDGPAKDCSSCLSACSHYA